MGWMTSLAATLVAWLADASVGIVGKVLVSLGMGVVTFTGLQVVISTALGYIGQDAQVATAMHAVGVDWLLSTILSGVSTRAVMSGLGSDAVTFWTMRGKIGT